MKLEQGNCLALSHSYSLMNLEFYRLYRFYYAWAVNSITIYFFVKVNVSTSTHHNYRTPHSGVHENTLGFRRARFHRGFASICYQPHIVEGHNMA